MSTLDIFVEKGRQEGLKEAEFKSKEWTEKVVRNLIRQTILTDEQIALSLEVTVDYVAETRWQLS